MCLSQDEEFFRKEMRMKKLSFVLLLLPVLAWAQSPFDGTWKIDLNSAKFPEKPETWVLQNGMYQESTSVPKINIKADGTDQVVQGAKDYDTMAAKVVDSRTVEFTDKKGGKVTSRAKLTVSPDGQTLSLDFTSYPVASPQPVTGKVAYTRVGGGPAGSHAISGSWRIQKVADISENALTTTIKSTPEGIDYSTSTGESYEGKYDGKDYPVKGVPPGYTVSLKKEDARTVVSTVKRDGKIVEVSAMTISADGKTASVKVENKLQGTTTTYKAMKQ
jgi:hypothetical protein